MCCRWPCRHDGAVHTQQAGPALRWARAALVSVVALLFGVTAHGSAEGLLPGPAALTCLLVLLVVPAARLLGRPASTARLVVLLVAGQAVVHVFLTLSAGHRGQHRASTPTPADASLPGTVAQVPARGRESLYDQLYAGRPEAPPARLTVPEPVRHLVADLSAHAPMALAHLVAAAGVGLWLAYGERLLWTVLTLSTHACAHLGRALASVLAEGRAALVASLLTGHRLVLLPRTATVSWHDVLSPPEAAVASSVVRRGPPRFLHA